MVVNDKHVFSSLCFDDAIQYINCLIMIDMNNLPVRDFSRFQHGASFQSENPLCQGDVEGIGEGHFNIEGFIFFDT